MKNTFGSSISLTVFGESHGPYVGVVVDGMPWGVRIDRDEIDYELSLRRPFGSISTGRVEKDEYEFAGGVFNDCTTGAPLVILVPNRDARSGDYCYGKARPSHADYTAFCKYNGYEDYRGGGHFSGRLTAPLVAAGAIFRRMLSAKGIYVGTHIAELADISDRGFGNVRDDIERLHNSRFPVLDRTASAQMMTAIEDFANKGDSAGGILETVINGVGAGVGEPFFDSVESCLSHAVFSIPGVKAVLFGAGIDFGTKTGSELNDPLEFTADGRVVSITNNDGGINGGLSNGMDIVFKTIVRPTPSIGRVQRSIDFAARKNIEMKISGRHDPCIVHRVRIVVDSLAMAVVCDLLAQRYGTAFFAES